MEKKMEEKLTQVVKNLPTRLSFFHKCRQEGYHKWSTEGYHKCVQEKHHKCSQEALSPLLTRSTIWSHTIW